MYVNTAVGRSPNATGILIDALNNSSTIYARCLRNKISAAMEDKVQRVIVHNRQEGVAVLAHFVVPENVVNLNRLARSDQKRKTNKAHRDIISLKQKSRAHRGICS